MSEAKGRTVQVAAIQMLGNRGAEANRRVAAERVCEAAAGGARIILLQELFADRYFCQLEDETLYEQAETLEDSRLVADFARLAAELAVVLPLSFYERAGNVFYNSIAILDADGSLLGVYRKAHIPDGPGYEEKFYFAPGDTGFRVWDTAYARIGVGICWDQWFPEAARIMSLLGAELLLYPTAIGSEPLDPAVDSAAHWQNCMIGHAAANLVPVIAANRVGRERMELGGMTSEITFYGHSFMTGPRGEILQQAGRSEEVILRQSYDLDELGRLRRGWGLYRDRRPDLYGPLLTLDGCTRLRE
ncbi:MAG: N-carbamoylputrescine amidase [Bacillota bacterium]|nr:N-carbamoylputrescine amidase [Bacillota bacterium]